MLRALGFLYDGPKEERGVSRTPAHQPAAVTCVLDVDGLTREVPIGFSTMQGKPEFGRYRISPFPVFGG